MLAKLIEGNFHLKGRLSYLFGRFINLFLSNKLYEYFGFRIIIASTYAESKRKCLEMNAYKSERWNKIWNGEAYHMKEDSYDSTYNYFLHIKRKDQENNQSVE